MRPLSANIKAAFFFYIGFLLILVLIHSGLASGWPMPFITQVSDANLSGWQPEELIGLQKSLDETWHRILADKGYRANALLEKEQSKLMTRKTGNQEFSWIYSQSQLVLPAAADESELVKMATAWKDLIERKGLTITCSACGYQDNRLWLKLKSGLKMDISGSRLTVSVVDITFIQKLSKNLKSKVNWQGLIPETPPKLTLIKPVAKKGAAPEKAHNPVQNASKVLPKVNPPPQSSTLPVLAVKPEQPSIPPLKRKARIAIIIDDVGYERKASEKMLEVPARLTWSVLPLTPYGREFAEAARDKGFEIMLHLPLEALSPKENPGPGVIRRNWEEEEIIRKLDEDLKTVPLARGINNHMGSAGTADDRLMDILMQQFKKRNLFFIDSFTNSQSIAGKYARKYGVLFEKRRIFIDHYDEYESKIKMLRELIKIALKEGTAIGIGHVRPGTPEAIMEMLPEITKAGIEIVPVSELVK